MKVLVTGATGFVGSRLVERLLESSHEVVVLSRTPDLARRRWSTRTGITVLPSQGTEWPGVLASCDGVVNLAGEPIAEKRWTPEQKQEILTSRAGGTQRLVEAIATARASSTHPQVLVNASAIGFYGTSETANFTEASPSGADFLAEVCRDWEAAAQPVQDAGVRLVILRLGIVVGEGGAVAKMLPAFRAFAGGPIGTGNQWFSWVYREDVVNLILKALTDPAMAGVYNATSPNPVTMAQLCQVIGEVLQRPSWLPVPGFALELLLGEGAKVVLEGQKVLPERTQTAGFQFAYPDLKTALQDFLRP